MILFWLWALVMALTIGSFVGYLGGWRDGVKDTERRWSAAVGRADEARRSWRGSR